MSSIVIKVEGLSKQYRLGEVSTGSIAHDVNRFWYRIRGKEDPYLKVGEDNERTSKGNSEYVWALRNINFEVIQGEILGIIGRNGAGKSTLLKILSRTTTPTTGSVKIKGRVASLLEVGTGFHPELSGRDNIFLNGAILGMTKKEITRKFDEIVDFAGVERYIDTPVKRYSSGMYVRLAFGVAAHLEPEILIVDEVLAVGDAEFQKKCLGKMKDVSDKDGRTVLFVSHNMTAMNSLCNSAIYMRNGKIQKIGEVGEVISTYLSSGTEITTWRKWDNLESPGDGIARLIEARLSDSEGNHIDAIDFYKGGNLEFTYEVLKEGYCPTPNLHLYNQKGDLVLVSAQPSDSKIGDKGIYQASMQIPPHLLNDGRFIAGIATSTFIPEKIHFYEREALVFDVIEDMKLRATEYRGVLPGIVRPKLEWTTIKKNI
jgi:lipopolysaccharide transport system ATP-binding protein